MTDDGQRGCSVGLCDRKHFGNGYCQIHHYRWRKHGDPLIIGKPKPRQPKPKQPCTFGGCEKPRYGRQEYCVRHYRRWQKYGDAAVQLPPRRGWHETWTHDQWVQAFTARFARAENGCLEWTGKPNEAGYGRVHFDGQQWFTHRLAYTLFVGPIPDGIQVCHRCDNPPCGEPTHLFLGDQAANLTDMRKKGRGYVPEPIRGSTHPRTQLSEDDVRAIRHANQAGENQSAIARRLGISREIVGNICRRKTWKHVD